MSHNFNKQLSTFLWIVSLHSFLVGIGLILLPRSVFEMLGFFSTFDRFFSTQGGVFHIAMSIGYALSASNLKKYKELIVFSIIVKFIATLFLMIYFLFISYQWLILVSAVTDLFMGIIILLLYVKLKTLHYFEMKSL